MEALETQQVGSSEFRQLNDAGRSALMLAEDAPESADGAAILELLQQ